MTLQPKVKPEILQMIATRTPFAQIESERMSDLQQVEMIPRKQRQRFADVEPIVYRDGDSVSLQFKIGDIQSEMLASDPNFLVLSYTRTMMAFMLFNNGPKRIAMIGLGGG